MNRIRSAGSGIPPSVPWPARPVARQWRRLAACAAPTERMSDALLDGLPEPARRWLSAAIPVGTPLWDGVEFVGRGTIRLGSWRPFTAQQILAVPDGFIWAATARFAGLPVAGFDRYGSDRSGSDVGEMRWRLLGVVPVMTGSGPHVTRSAAGRFAAEATALLPTAFRHATWTADPDPDIAMAAWHVAGLDHVVRVRVDRDGGLSEVSIDRWGNPDGGPYGNHPFVVTVDAERRFDGVRMISAFRAGWRTDGSEPPAGEFFRAEITGVRFIGRPAPRGSVTCRSPQSGRTATGADRVRTAPGSAGTSGRPTPRSPECSPRTGPGTSTAPAGGCGCSGSWS